MKTTKRSAWSVSGPFQVRLSAPGSEAKARSAKWSVGVVTRFATRIVTNGPLGDTKGSMVVSGSRKRW